MLADAHLIQPVRDAAEHGARLRQIHHDDHHRGRDLLRREEQLVALADGLCKLVATAHLPDVRKVLALVIIRRRLACVRVLEALGRLGHLRLHAARGAVRTCEQ
eukprot:218727-Chlamydomonas_euryale.AAC.1